VTPQHNGGVEPSRRAESFNRTAAPPAYPDGPPTEIRPSLGVGPPPLLPPDPPSAPRRSATPFLVTALVLALIGLVAATVGYLDQRAEAERLAEQLERANQRIEDLEQQLEALDQTDESGIEDILDQILEDLFGEGVGGPSGDGDPFGDIQLLQCLAPSGFTGEVDEVEGNAPEQVDEIGDLVAGDRGLGFVAGEPEPTFLEPAATGQRVIDLNRDELTPEEADLDARLLESLGAIDPGTDLREITFELLASGVAGFYVPSTGELVVRADDPDQPLDPGEQVTLAHELDHALADQNHELLDEDLDLRGADAALAGLSFIEGDANLAGQRFALAHISLQDQVDMSQTPEVTEAQSTLDAAPHFLARQLLFPYREGMTFVCSRFLEGGWGAVDQLYANPPATTIEILVPERLGQPPATVPETASPPAPWTEARRDTFGAADLLFLFEAPGDDETRALADPMGAASAWAGGSYRLYVNGSASALSLSLAAVTGQEATLCAAIEEFAAAAELPGSAVVRCEGPSVRLGVAPDPAVAETLVAG
jgi:hypothetical protein